MNTLDHAGRFAMLRGHLLETPPGRFDVACADGTLWVTLDNDPRDFVLDPGDTLRVEPRHRVLVHALDDSVLVLREVQPERPSLLPRLGWFGATLHAHPQPA